jgi:hypothetical protein
LKEFQNGYQETVRKRTGRNAFKTYTVQRFDFDKFAQLIAEECIKTIQWKIPPNGYTPENYRSLMHVSQIAEKFDIKLPL